MVTKCISFGDGFPNGDAMGSRLKFNLLLVLVTVVLAGCAARKPR
jgi:hypothetical protein